MFLHKPVRLFRKLKLSGADLIVLMGLFFSEEIPKSKVYDE